MAKVGVAGREFHYERAGSGEPLLLIQGMSGTHVAWGRAVSGRPWRRASTSSPSTTGESGSRRRSTGPFTIVEMAEDTAGLLEELGLESAHVVGISMGGMIAQELALAAPGAAALADARLHLLRRSRLAADAGGEPAEAGRRDASGDRDKAIRAGYEVNLSPAFRADEGNLRRLPRDGDQRARRQSDDRTAGAGDLRPRHQRPPRRDLGADADRPRHRRRRPPLPQRRADRLADARRPASRPSRASATCSGGSSRSAPPS